MTRICHREYYDRILIVAEGHSGYGVSGKDIVCAGISTLICTLVNCIKEEESADRLKLRRDIVRDGYVCLEFEVFDYAKERVSGIVDACLTGLYMLCEEYPEYVRVE